MLNSFSRTLHRFLLKEQFNPSLLGLFLNPFYFARKSIYKNIKKYSDHINGITLDIGCGSKPYIDLFFTDKYIGMDVEVSGHNHSNERIDVYYNGTSIPFASDYFDSVVCFEVLEHVFNPIDFLKEANRVIRPGGYAIFTVPFIWDEHEQPFDYARYSSFGLNHLFENSGFTVIKKQKYLCDLRLLTLLLNVYVYKVVRRLIPNKLSYIFILPVTSINNLFGCLLYLLPRNPDLYYGNVFLLRKVV